MFLPHYSMPSSVKQGLLPLSSNFTHCRVNKPVGREIRNQWGTLNRVVTSGGSTLRCRRIDGSHVASSMDHIRRNRV